ncbi:MAG: ABC transporter permease [Holophagae bacterium]|jgi:ABC-2 type transport system permease protein
MSLAVFRAMLISLVRDRAALAMSFILPVLFFLIFAAIFAGATGQQLRLKLAVADELQDEISARLVEALDEDPGLLIVGDGTLEPEVVRDWVRRGTADIGLIVRADGDPLDSLGGFGPSPLVVVSDPVRGAAVPMLKGQIQKAYFSALPDVALDGVVGLIEDQFIELSDDQRTDLEAGFEELRLEAEAGEVSGWGFEDLFEDEAVAGQSAAQNHVAYYAGAVAMLFLLFSAVHGAISLIEERDSGILDRILAGPGRIGVLVNGKFFFLVVQGFVQVGIIFVVAWLVHGVDLPGHAVSWAVTTVLAAAAASALALLVASACRTRRQAQTLSNVAILVISAVGGSMVPRFFMPEWVQDAGWLTPNTWALEAYTVIFWRDDSVADLMLPWFMLAVAAAVALWLARRSARRLEIL